MFANTEQKSLSMDLFPYSHLSVHKNQVYTRVSYFQAVLKYFKWKKEVMFTAKLPCRGCFMYLHIKAHSVPPTPAHCSCCLNNEAKAHQMYTTQGTTKSEP